MFTAYNIADDKRQKALLLTYGGDDLNDLVESLPADSLVPPEGQTHVNQLIKAVELHFNPETTTEFQKFAFRRTIQKTDNIDEFYSELKQLAPTCNFHDADSEIKSQLIAGCKSDKVRGKGLSTPDIKLPDLLRFARTLQLTTSQGKMMSLQSEKHDQDVNKVEFRRHKENESEKHHAVQRCRNCSGSWPHEGGRHSCPAFGKQCRTCNKSNHFASVCRSKPGPIPNATLRPPRPNHMRRNKYHVKQLDEQFNHLMVDEESEEEDEDYENYVYTTRSTLNSLPHFEVCINDQSFNILADSGATVNLLSEADFKRITPSPQLKPSNAKIQAYGSQQPLSVIGKFNATLRSSQTTVKAPICVVPGEEIPILCWSTSQELRLLTTVNTVGVTASPSPPPQDEFSDLYKGLGKLKNTQVKLHIDTSVTPVAQHYRRTPFHVRKHIEEQIKKDEALGIIEKATGPTPWVSPVVVVPKPKSPGKVRVCVDMRSANRAIQRERHSTPTLDELKAMLTGASVFSKLDLNQGYNQLELDEESRYITTFATHLGLYRYKRLFFGVNSASEIFQETIRQALAGLHGVVNISDDTLCFGTSQEDHDRNLKALFQRVREQGLTLNKEKCEFNKNSIEFLGHVFSKDGVKPSESKLKTILDLPAPKNASEVRSLLGMTNFCGSHFVPNYAELTHDLRQLTKKTSPWSWTDKHDEALKNLKTGLHKAVTLAYFDPNKTTEVYTDASPVGISAVLTQDDLVVQFASRPLTPTEQRYSQTEREALAITWACEYFHIYLFGDCFSVYTDHKPLTTIFNNPRANLSARIERWIMRTQPYKMTVHYRPGHDNPADYLSRHPICQAPSSREEKIAEEYLHYVVNTSIPKTMSVDDVAAATAKDPTLLAAIDSFLTNNWNFDSDNVDSKTLHTLYLCRAELSLAHDNHILLKGRRIVLPESLQQQAVKLAHTGHQGIVKTLSLLREKVWFRGMQQAVEDTVKTCLSCQISTPLPAREPLKMSPLPTAPWTEISADFGHMPNGQYILVVSDEYSRYPIVDILDTISARAVIPRLDKIFAEFGIPTVLKTDNGPPFNSHDFATFAKHTGFTHRKITPLWPRANAETERFMRSVKKTVKAASALGGNWKQEMYRFLLDYRTTPHCSTGLAPATVFFGRDIRNRLPHLPVTPQHDATLRRRDTDAKAMMKHYADQKAYVKPSGINVNDPVLVKDTSSYPQTPYQPIPMTVVKKKGSIITAQRGHQLITRNSSFFKKAPRPPTSAEVEAGLVTDDDSVEPVPHIQPNAPDFNPQMHAPCTPAPNIPVHPPLRRTSRTTQLPQKFKDFVLTK